MNYTIKKIAKELLLGNSIGHRLYVFFGDIVRRNRSNLTDEEFVKKSFKENNDIQLDLDNPLTFNEKLLWLSLHDREELKTQCADKYRVREYITAKGYSYILNPLYGVYGSTAEIEFEKMPMRFFVKTNHDSGTYALIDKSNTDTFKSLKKIDEALTRNYYYESREWQYKDIVPRVLCEAFIETDEPYGLLDYRFFCSKGELLFIAVDMGTTDTSGKHQYFAQRNIYNEKFELLDAKLKREHFDSELIKKPKNFEKMLEIAKDLSKPFRHVRVDFYNVAGKIIFGELTFCNGGGMQLLEPYEFNVQMGQKILLE